MNYSATVAALHLFGEDSMAINLRAMSRGKISRKEKKGAKTQSVYSAKEKTKQGFASLPLCLFA